MRHRLAGAPGQRPGSRPWPARLGAPQPRITRSETCSEAIVTTPHSPWPSSPPCRRACRAPPAAAGGWHRPWRVAAHAARTAGPGHGEGPCRAAVGGRWLERQGAGPGLCSSPCPAPKGAPAASPALLPSAGGLQPVAARAAGAGGTCRAIPARLHDAMLAAGEWVPAFSTSRAAARLRTRTWAGSGRLCSASTHCCLLDCPPSLCRCLHCPYAAAASTAAPAHPAKACCMPPVV